jgi:CDP-diacylglycerol---serine O-phosphatidyltransferase
MKRIAIVPTLLTLGNALCGFAAVVVASGILPCSDGQSKANNNLYFASGVFILLAMVFDALDGYAARLFRSASEFGGQLDSLCDAISFGLAPAYLLLKLGVDWQNEQARQVLAGLAALYLSCAVLRLARFNTENSTDPASHKRFKGLPSPAAAGCIVALVLLRAQSTLIDEARMLAFVNIWAPLGAAIVSLLMVSRLPYPHFTNRLMRGRRSFSVVVQAVIVIFLVALTRDLACAMAYACFLLFWAYAFHTPARFLLGQFRREAKSVSTIPSRTDHLPQ